MAVSSLSLFRRIPVRFTLESLTSLFSDYPKRDFRVRLWDGTSWGSDKNPTFTLVLKDRAASQHMLSSPSELSLGESYIFGELDVEGDLEAAFELGDYLISQQRENPAPPPWLAKLLAFPAPQDTAWANNLEGPVHSKERDRRAISYHYDLPPEFFALWLDQRRQYSCAHFADRERSDLDAAQLRKLDYIFRKLRLSPGDRLLDIGCGWGGLLLHAAANYGVEVVGITLSVPQAEVAREQIRIAGLNDRCRVEVCDYRDLEIDEQFDKIVSVGMFEHVGESQLREYFSRVWQLLRPGGAFLNSGIAASATYERPKPSFIERYVFPDGELVPISASLAAAEGAGFEVRDVESLREHYALTLHHWVQRLEAHAAEAERCTSRTTYRIWRLYMAASAHAFRTGRINLYHALFSKPHDGNSGIALTRADWYRQ